MSNPHAAHYTQENPFLDRVYALKSPSEARSVYDEWAASYDKDLSAQDYTYPSHAAKLIIANLPTPAPAADRSANDGGSTRLKVLDAGCGTGLVGVRLLQALSESQADPKPSFEIDGLDISPGMLSIATKTGVYSTLKEADLSKPLAPEDGIYDVVSCVGTLTTGHVGPSVIPEFVRVLKNSGVIVATILEAVWESMGFKDEIEILESSGKVKVLEVRRVGIVGDKDEGGMVLVLKKL